MKVGNEILVLELFKIPLEKREHGRLTRLFFVLSRNAKEKGCCHVTLKRSVVVT